jgi:site-specific recombinase XerD
MTDTPTITEAERTNLAIPTEIKMEDHPVTLYLLTLSQNSRRTQLSALEQVVKVFTNGENSVWEMDWQNMQYKHMVQLRTLLHEREELAFTTVNRYLSAVRAVMKECWRLELVDRETYERIRDVENISGERLPSGRLLTPDEIKKLLQACDLDWQKRKVSGVRDAAIITMLYLTGMRRSEIIALQLTDYDVSTGEITIREGKGNKDRNVFIRGDKARKRIADWLNARSYIKASSLFLTVNPYGDLTNSPITAGQTIYDLLHRRAEQAGIEEFSPHNLRHTSISEMWDAGIDGVTIKDTAGHKDIETAARYDRRGDQRKIDAAEKRDLPL